MADKLFNLNQQAGVEVQGECADVSNPAGCTLAWTRESNTWICKYVLKQSIQWLESNDLSQEYYEKAVPIMEELVGKG